MEATVVVGGERALPDEPGWAYEMCWSGPRLLVDISAARVIAVDASADKDVTIRYPELVAMSEGIDDALVDGYLVSVGDAPVHFVVADLLRLYGVDLTARPYRERRRSLDQLAAAHPLLTISPAFDDLAATSAAAHAHGLSGVLAKRLSSIYAGGTTSADWIEARFPNSGPGASSGSARG